MLVDLKLDGAYDGFVYRSVAALNPPYMNAHRHVELELNLVMAGSITYLVSGRRHTFGPGCLVWLLPSQDHQLIHRDPATRLYVAVFKMPLVSAAGVLPDYEAHVQSDPQGTTVLSRLLDPATQDFLDRVMAEALRDGPDETLLNRELGYGIDSDFRYFHGDPEALNAALRFLLSTAWRHSRGRREPLASVALHPAVHRAMLLIAEDNEAMDLGEIARRCGISSPHLSRLFRRQAGVPLSRYRNSVRLTRFFNLHRQRRKAETILELALAAGFGSYAQFHKTFHDAYGHGPGEFAKQARGAARPRPRQSAS